MTDRQAIPAASRTDMQVARGRRRSLARKALASLVVRAGLFLAAVLLLAVGLSDRAVRAQMTDETAVLTITAGSDTYGYQIDDVVFTVTRTGPAEEEIGGSVTMPASGSAAICRRTKRARRAIRPGRSASALTRWSRAA